MRNMIGLGAVALSALLAGPGAALGAEFDPAAAHQKFVDAFNNRQWDQLKSLLAEDSVFHRANAEEVYVGPDAIVGRFSETIGNPDQWNVKFVRLDSEAQLKGAADGRVVERGDFAITAGADDSSCYAGSYMATWAPASDDWKLQVLSWQDVETDPSTCS